MEATHSDIGSEIREKGVMSDELQDRLSKAIDEFKEYFAAGHRSNDQVPATAGAE